MPEQFKSSPEVIGLAREWMQKTKASFNDFKNDSPEHKIIRDSLTHAWDGPSWSDMGGETKRGMLESALAEFVWDIDTADEGPLIDEFLNGEKRQLFAEMRHDYGLRLLEERGVRYQDEGECTPVAAKDRPPSPGEIARDNSPAAPEQGNGHDNGRGR